MEEIFEKFFFAMEKIFLWRKKLWQQKLIYEFFFTLKNLCGEFVVVMNNLLWEKKIMNTTFLMKICCDEIFYRWRNSILNCDETKKKSNCDQTQKLK